MTKEGYLELLEKSEFEQKKFFLTSTDKEFTTISQSENYYYVDTKVITWATNRLVSFKKSSIGFCIKGSKIYFRGCTPKLLIKSVGFPKRFYNIDWLPSYYEGYLTPSLFRKIVTKKITNPTEFAKHIRTYYFKDKTLKIKAIQNFSQALKQTSYNSMVVIKSIYRFAPKLFNFNIFDNVIVERDKISFLEDLLHDAFLLNRKFDLKWSSKRLNEWHLENVREIMLQEMKEIPVVEYEVPALELPHKYELIKDNVTLMTEGKIMNNCIYSHYKERIQSGNYIAIKHAEMVNIGLAYGYKGWFIEQIKGYRNCNAPLSITKEVEEFILPQLKDYKPKKVGYDLPF